MSPDTRRVRILIGLYFLWPPTIRSILYSVPGGWAAQWNYNFDNEIKRGAGRREIIPPKTRGWTSNPSREVRRRDSSDDRLRAAPLLFSAIGQFGRYVVLSSMSEYIMSRYQAGGLPRWVLLGGVPHWVGATLFYRIVGTVRILGGLVLPMFRALCADSIRMGYCG